MLIKNTSSKVFIHYIKIISIHVQSVAQIKQKSINASKKRIKNLVIPHLMRWLMNTICTHKNDWLSPISLVRLRFRWMCVYHHSRSVMFNARGYQKNERCRMCGELAHCFLSSVVGCHFTQQLPPRPTTEIQLKKQCIYSVKFFSILIFTLIRIESSTAAALMSI